VRELISLLIEAASNLPDGPKAPVELTNRVDPSNQFIDKAEVDSWATVGWREDHARPFPAGRAGGHDSRAKKAGQHRGRHRSSTARSRGTTGSGLRKPAAAPRHVRLRSLLTDLLHLVVPLSGLRSGFPSRTLLVICVLIRSW
jgi:hypothetical protein